MNRISFQSLGIINITEFHQKRVDNAYVLPTNIKLNVEISKDINDDYFKISRKKQEYFFKDTKKEKRQNHLKIMLIQH